MDYRLFWGANITRACFRFPGKTRHYFLNRIGPQWCLMTLWEGQGEADLFWSANKEALMDAASRDVIMQAEILNIDLLQEG